MPSTVPPASLACLDGRVCPPAEARIPVTDEGLLRGDGVFEVLRLYSGRPFALEDHLARLERSAANLRLPIDVDAVRADIDRILAAAGPVEALLRVVLTRGGHRVLLVEGLPQQPTVARVASVTYAPSRVLTQVKSLSYAGNMLAARLAAERGFDDALFVTPHGRVLEGPTWSFFWVSGGQLYTPPLSDLVLDSITRRRVIEESSARERPCTLDEVARAEEAFIASTLREVLPIATVDDIALPSAPGPVTEEAARRLRRRIQRELTADADVRAGASRGT